MKNVVLTKNAFDKSNIYQKNIEEIEVPELNSMMGLKEGEVATIKIRQLTLDEFISLRSSMNDYFRNLVDGIIAAAIEKKEIQDEATYLWNKLSPDAKYSMDICHIGIIEPNLTRAELLFLKEMFPNIIIRLSSRIIELTNGGASLKKNF